MRSNFGSAGDVVSLQSDNLVTLNVQICLAKGLPRTWTVLLVVATFPAVSFAVYIS